MTRSLHKQPVFGSRGVVCANQPIAASAGLTMLANGGTVADAAIATIATCSVVEPQMVSPLGGGYILHRRADGAVSAIDNRTEGPGRATEDMFEMTDSGAVIDDANATGHRAAGVPGAIKGWLAFHAIAGRLPLPQVLAPAIAVAANGFPVSPLLHKTFHHHAALLARFPETARVFLPEGRVPNVGETFTNPDLARSLATLAEQGADYLYHGELGERVVAEMERGGGLISAEDLEGYDLRFPEPIRGTYRGYDVIGTPLSSAGGLLNQLGLNILENFDCAALGFGTAEYWHLLIECLKLMSADRNRYLGDPRFVEVPQEELLSKTYAKDRAALIERARASQFEPGDPRAPRDASHTTHVTVMDSDGNAVSMTQTINLAFGSRVVVPGTGMLLNDNMASFDPRAGRPNSPGPHKRMLSSMAATIVERDGQLEFALGTPGGTHIYPAVFQSMLNVMDHEMTLQEAVEAPRVWADRNHTLVEYIADDAVVGELDRLGHRIDRENHIAGNTNGVQVDRTTGLLLGASCWRGDGSPAAISGGFAAAEPGAPS